MGSGTLTGLRNGYATVNGLDGSYEIIDIPPGTYYVRINADSVPGYRPEAWDDVPCSGCDVVVHGTPIVVTGSDIQDVNFELVTELITSDSFE